MSKLSIRSKASAKALIQRRKREKMLEKNLTKPFGFCCSLDLFDPLTKYGTRLPRESSLTSIEKVNESPVLRFQAGPVGFNYETKRRNVPLRNGKRKKDVTMHAGDNNENRNKIDFLDEEAVGNYSSAKPLKWYVENEITWGKDALWEQRAKEYNIEMDKNTAIGKIKTKKKWDMITNLHCPRWYQDFSIDQMKNLAMLECVLNQDYEEMVTGRTQRALLAIGITSTFFKVPSKDIKQLQKTTELNVIEFLREIYKMLTGQYFEEEEYKADYDCNEKLILSAIAFLTLPELIIELQKRLPPVEIPKFPPKPVPPVRPTKKKMSSPYLEDLFLRPDWASYRNKLEVWHEHCKSMAIPKVLMPPKDYIFSISKKKDTEKGDQKTRVPSQKFNQGSALLGDLKDSKDTKGSTKTKEKDATKAKVPARKTSTIPAKGKEKTDNQNIEQKRDSYFDIPRLPDENKVYDFTINGISEKRGPVEYKICGVLQPPQPNKKSWLGGKDAHYVISGVSDDPPTCPVTYEISGIANVTPTNSDERFFTVLKLGDGPKKIYPSGRKHLSKYWQEWLLNVDEEFRQVEKEADKMIKSIEATMRLVFPDPKCDSCCSCRQTRKTRNKSEKAPYFMIDTIAEDDSKKKYIVGSMAMHSPAPTPPESTVNLMEVIASEEQITTNVMINGVTNDKGETQYFISGVKKDTIRIPSRKVDPPPPGPLKNVPTCVCAVHQIFNKGLSPKTSYDNILGAKDEICCGKKYRPAEPPAYTCKMSLGQSCKKNPFMRDIEKQKRKREREKSKALNDETDETPAEKKKMYSTPDFQPCGDEVGMAVCGGPWGALNTLTPKELKEQEKLKKEMLTMPPCGKDQGLAVCGGPFGAKIPYKKSRVAEEDEPPEEDEDDEEDEGEEAEAEVEAPVKVQKEKVKHRDESCHMSPDAIASRKKEVEEVEEEVILDPNYVESDDQWNLCCTAPSEKDSFEINYEQTLRLSAPEPRTTLPKRIKLKEEEGSEQDEIIRRISRKGVYRSTDRRDSKRKGPTPLVKKPLDKNTKLNSKAEGTAEIQGGRKIADKTKKQKNKKNLNGKVISSKKVKSSPRSSIVPTRTPGRLVESAKPKVDQERNNLRPKRSSKVHETEVKGDDFLMNKSLKKISRTPTFNKFLKREKKSSHQYSSNAFKTAMAEVKNMMKSDKTYPFHVEPVILPEKPRVCCQREPEETKEEVQTAKSEQPEKEPLPTITPCGWRTKSEQELPAKKNLAYLVEFDFPIERVPVRPGGKPCTCRENRLKKKLLTIEELKAKEDGTKSSKLRKTDKEEQNLKLVDGVFHYSPPLSPARSDEYVPEYELADSLYNTCQSKRKDECLKLLEQYSGPKSLMSKARKKIERCGCSDLIDSKDIENKKNKEFEKIKQEYMESISPKERWSLAVKDVGLTDYFTRYQDNLPCWLQCAGFNKTGHPTTPSKLKAMRPVCECKYERKILEHRDEKKKYKDRQRKLKALKKEPFLNIENTSRPTETGLKLMISGVKRIPREDEYIDDIKYCVTGLTENLSMAPPERVIGGLNMSTPAVTPEPSQHVITYDRPHRHWSPMNIPPGPLPRKDEALINEKKRRQKALEEACKQIYGPQEVYDPHVHSCQGKSICNKEVETKGSIFRSQRLTEDTPKSQVKLKKDKTKDRNEEGKGSPKRKEKKQLKLSPEHKEETDTEYRGKEEQNKRMNIETSEKEIRTNAEDQTLPSENKHKRLLHDDKADVSELVKAELKKMSAEGFIFAKLPACFTVPQLQTWIMYRKGFAFSEAEKLELIHHTRGMWNLMTSMHPPEIKIPSLDLSNSELINMTFAHADKMHDKIARGTALFQSQVRKARVVFARGLWNTMEYGKFPSTSFKEAYFTYLGSKEADGHVFRPWIPVRK